MRPKGSTLPPQRIDPRQEDELISKLAVWSGQRALSSVQLISPPPIPPIPCREEAWEGSPKTLLRPHGKLRLDEAPGPGRKLRGQCLVTVPAQPPPSRKARRILCADDAGVRAPVPTRPSPGAGKKRGVSLTIFVGPLPARQQGVSEIKEALNGPAGRSLPYMPRGDLDELPGLPRLAGPRSSPASGDAHPSSGMPTHGFGRDPELHDSMSVQRAPRSAPPPAGGHRGILADTPPPRRPPWRLG